MIHVLPDTTRGWLCLRTRLAGLLFCLLCLQAQPTVAAHDGDINIDSTVNIVDLLWGIQALTGIRLLNATQQEHGDVAPLVDGYSVPDGVFNAGDILVLWRVVHGTIVLAFAGVPDNQFSAGDSIAEGEAAAAEAIAGSLQAACKVKGEVSLVKPGELPNDGKVIDDRRSYE